MLDCARGAGTLLAGAMGIFLGPNRRHCSISGASSRSLWSKEGGAGAGVAVGRAPEGTEARGGVAGTC